MDLKKTIIIISSVLAVMIVIFSVVMTCIELKKAKAKNSDSNSIDEVSEMIESSEIKENNSNDNSSENTAVQSSVDAEGGENNTEPDSSIGLSFNFPKERSFTTTEVVMNFTGTSDPKKPVYVNGNAIERNGDGTFLYTAQLIIGKNTITFEHKNKTQVFEIERKDPSIGSSKPVMGDYAEAKTLDEYLSKGVTTITGSSKNKNSWVYKINSTGIYVREVDIDLGGNNEYTIAHLTDLHLVAMNEADFLDSQLSKSFASRKDSFPDAERNAKIAMKYASFFDKTIITGDVLDYLSNGALDLLKHIIGKNNVLVTMGNHDYRKVWYDTYTDTVDVEERFAVCQEKWQNNIHYQSEIIADKFMIVTMNNGSDCLGTYENYYDKKFTAKDAKGNTKTATMDEFFADDLKTAKDNGYKILLFQHSPISTNNSASTIDLVNGTPNDFKGWYIGSKNLKQTDVDKKVYSLITENANIIKGVFCGHTHGNFYTEIKAKSTPSANKSDSVIPQYVLGLNAKLYGNAIKITVKY